MSENVRDIQIRKEIMDFLLVPQYDDEDLTPAELEDVENWMYELCGPGFTALDESPNAQTDSVTYISDASATVTTIGYETQFSFNAELITSENAIRFIYLIGTRQRLGSAAETDYVRVEGFFPHPTIPNSYIARRFRVAVEVTDVTGDGGQKIEVSGNLNNVGSFTEGYFNIATKVFTAMEAPVPAP